DQGWSDCDLTVYRGMWSKVDLKVAVENHGGSKRFFRTRSRVRETFLSRVTLFGFAALAVVGWFAGLTEIALLAAMLGVITFIVVASDNYRLGRVMYQVVEIVGKQIGLTPVNGKAK